MGGLVPVSGSADVVSQRRVLWIENLQSFVELYFGIIIGHEAVKILQKDRDPLHERSNVGENVFVLLCCSDHEVYRIEALISGPKDLDEHQSGVISVV